MHERSEGHRSDAILKEGDVLSIMLPNFAGESLDIFVATALLNLVFDNEAFCFATRQEMATRTLAEVVFAFKDQPIVDS